MGGLLKILVASTVVVLAAGIAAVLLIPPVPSARMARRHAQVRQLLDGLVDAIWAYHRETGDFPPGDGSGSAGLLRALGDRSRQGNPYLAVPPEMVTSTGDLRNPLAPEMSIFYYRLRCSSEGDGLECGFDLWCHSPEGWDIGVSDWAPAVSPP